MKTMYAPAHFREDRIEVLREAIRNLAFATVITTSEGTVEANHIPLLLKGDTLNDTLAGHFARANPVWKTLSTGAEVLVVFMGPHFYTSPTWYPSKAATGKGVPTWNYIAVHVRGTVTLHEEPEWLRAHVGELSHEHEHFRPTPWAPEQAPADYIQSLIRAIVGIEISITGIEGKWKLGQNRPQGDGEGIRQALVAEGRPDLAELIKF
jgi:transcriptional regulator